MLFFCDQLITMHQAVTSSGCSWYDRIRAFKQDANFPQDSVGQLWPLAYISSMTDVMYELTQLTHIYSKISNEPNLQPLNLNL